jgi:tRNA threonylcarbamoyladenosine biosynthesis protein TsaB
VIVLALDTTTPSGSCAIAGPGGRVLEQAGDRHVSHAARLPADLMALLAGAGVSLHEVDLFAVATGPGSFTGLRVGIATLQGLAFAGGRPLVGVSTLDALAVLGGAQVARVRDPGAARVATWVDAWRGEVYAALYQGGREIEGPSVEPPDTILERLTGDPVLFIGDGAEAHAGRIAAAFGGGAIMADPPAPLLAGTIARMAAASARAGARPPPDAIRPLYVRRPDAELSRDGRPRP